MISRTCERAPFKICVNVILARSHLAHIVCADEAIQKRIEVNACGYIRLLSLANGTFPILADQANIFERDIVEFRTPTWHFQVSYRGITSDHENMQTKMLY